MNTKIINHSADIFNASDTSYVIDAPNVTLAFIGGTGDAAVVRASSDTVIDDYSKNMSINAEHAQGLSLLLAGNVGDMNIFGWSEFASNQHIYMFDQGHYQVHASEFNPSITGLYGGGQVNFESCGAYALYPAQISSIG